MYRPDQDRSVSDAIIQAIINCKETELKESDFTLYDHIDPDILDALFRDGACSNLMVDFTVDDVYVRCWVDDGVEIRVTESIDLP